MAELIVLEGKSKLVRDVAALKVSGERIFVLNEGPKQQDNVTCYWCRRVQIGQQGITHLVELFSGDEIETVHENIVRELNENVEKEKLRRKIYDAAEAEMAATEVNKTAQVVEIPANKKVN